MIKDFFKSFNLVDWVIFICSVTSTILAIPNGSLSECLGWLCATIWFCSYKLVECLNRELETTVTELLDKIGEIVADALDKTENEDTIE